MPPALFAHPFVRCDHQNRRIRARCARDHVLQELFVTGRVDDEVVASRRSKRDLRRINRNVLLLLLEQGVEHESKLKFHPFRRARLLHHVDLSFRQRIRVVQNAPDERGLAVINVADEDDLQRQSR